MRWCAPVVFAAVGLAAIGAAPAQQAQRPSAVASPVLSDNAKAVLGPWEFSNADRDRICAVTLRGDPAGSAFRIEFDDRCAAAFPLVSEIAGWRMTDNELLRFVDAAGKTIAEFTEVEGGLYEAPTPGYGVLFLQNAASAAPPPPSVEQVSGEWSLQRSGKELCAVTLTSTEVRDSGYAVRLKPGCDAQIVRFDPVAWRIDRGELVIGAKSGDAWRFEESEGSWRRIPARTDGMVLMKR